MILQRLATSIRKQDWFTVLIETLIVVLGVFLGLQVNNWNEASQAHSREAIILEQLATEFTAAVEQTKRASDRNDILLDATRKVLGIVRAGQEPKDGAGFLESLELAGSFVAGPPEPVTLTELLSTGGLSALSSADLRTALVQYHETSEQQKEMSGLVLARLSTPLDGFHDAIFVNPDYRGPTDVFLDGYEWEQIEHTRQQFQVLMIGRVSLGSILEEQINRSETVLAEIEAYRQ
ncbi:MAG: hypothetical protein RLN72_04435 [Henriciella sp.]